MKRKGFLYWLIILVGVSFIVAASINIGYKLTENNTSSKSSSKYNFNYNDGAEPGITYKGYIDKKTGYVKMEVFFACTAPDCGELDEEVYEGKLTTKQLELVNEILNSDKYSKKNDVVEAVYHIIKEKSDETEFLEEIKNS